MRQLFSLTETVDSNARDPQEVLEAAEAIELVTRLPQSEREAVLARFGFHPIHSTISDLAAEWKTKPQFVSQKSRAGIARLRRRYGTHPSLTSKTD